MPARILGLVSLATAILAFPAPAAGAPEIPALPGTVLTDEYTGTWSLAAQPPGPVEGIGFSTVYAPELDSVILIGGFGSGTGVGFENDIWVLDRASPPGVWSPFRPAGPSPLPRLYEVPGREVSLSVGSAGLDPASVEYEPPITPNADGSFEGSVNVFGLNGPQTVYARACFGDGNCAYATADVVLP